VAWPCEVNADVFNEENHMKVIVKTQDDLDYFIGSIKDRKVIPGKKYRAEYSEIRKKRTHDQNSVLHIWFRCLAIELEGDPAAANWYKEYYKSVVLPGIAEPEIKIIRGVTLKRYSVADLNTLQESQLMSFMKRDAFDQFGIRLLTQDEKQFDEFHETYK